MINKELLNIYKGKDKTIIIESVELIHNESNIDLCFCKYPSELNLVIEDNSTKLFKPSNFIVELPSYQSNNSNLNISITFSTVNFKEVSTLENILRTSEENILIKYRLYTENNLKYPQTQVPFIFTITAVDFTNKTMTLSGSLLISVQTKIPNKDYTLDLFKGLKYL